MCCFSISHPMFGMWTLEQYTPKAPVPPAARRERSTSYGGSVHQSPSNPLRRGITPTEVHLFHLCIFIARGQPTAAQVLQLQTFVYDVHACYCFFLAWYFQLLPHDVLITIITTWCSTRHTSTISATNWLYVPDINCHHLYYVSTDSTATRG